MCKTLVLSMGNELRGDDGIGPAVVDKLRRSCVLAPDVELMDCGIKDLSTLLIRQDISRLVIVDAADMNLEPGEWRRLDLKQAGVEILGGTGLDQGHGLGISQVLLLGKVLGTLPSEIVLFAVQPQMVGYRIGLSEALQNAVTEVCEAIHNELELTPQGVTLTNLNLLPRSGLTETRV